MKELYEHYIVKDNILFKHARGKSAMEGREIHPYHEILYFVNGAADFLSENKRITLEPDTLLMIPKETFHQFAIKNQNTYERYIINFPTLPAYSGLITPLTAHISIVRTPGRNIRTLFERLANVFYENFNEYEKQTFLFAALLQLLLEMKQISPEFAIPESRSLDSVIARALQYIHLNYLEQLHIGDVASHTGVSKSQLSHTFKKELHISVYRYITEKRLIHANKLIAGCVSPTEAAAICGFNDYSAFYKAYRKFFGYSPSQQAL